ncbi:MAG: VOC family protein [Pseudomonadales bacterium]|nr:VOC family protein [Pseudomonadales bacterium]
MNICSLGYIGIGAPDPLACLEFATHIVGMMPARACAGEDWGMPALPGRGPASAGSGQLADGSVYLKLDDWQWRIAVHLRAGRPGLLYMGLELASEIALEQALAELRAAGCEAQRGTEAQARARAVAGIVHTHDPMGNAIELFYAPVKDRKFSSPHGARFCAGSLGIGHLNLLAAPLVEARDFYTRVLGFRLTDFIRFGAGDSANFFHCNARHHSIGLLKVAELAGVHHLMLELESIDMVGQCLGRVEDAGLQITSTLGRHANDRMLSFYVASPFGFELEIGCDGLRIDDQWTPAEFVEGDIWGHRGLDPETIQRNLAAAGGE